MSQNSFRFIGVVGQEIATGARDQPGIAIYLRGTIPIGFDLNQGDFTGIDLHTRNGNINLMVC